MTTHNLHKDTHEYGLADGCPRCREHAADPFAGLDDENLFNLYARVRTKEDARSLNEALAMDEVRRVMRLVDIALQWNARILSQHSYERQEYEATAERGTN